MIIATSGLSDSETIHVEEDSSYSVSVAALGSAGNITSESITARTEEASRLRSTYSVGYREHTLPLLYNPVLNSE